VPTLGDKTTLTHSAMDRCADVSSTRRRQATVLIGFDSAWANKKNAPGAICSVLCDGVGFMDFRPPELIDFDGALYYIQSLQRPDMPTLVALDQPTLVPNETGMRPVARAVASLISWMGGDVQPANRGLPLFREDAPIHGFLKKLGATEDPEAARTAKRGLHLMEVFPALALASLDASFFGRGTGPRYNPARQKTFRVEHWRAVIAAAQAEAASFECSSLAAWLDEQRGTPSPKRPTRTVSTPPSACSSLSVGGLARAISPSPSAT